MKKLFLFITLSIFCSTNLFSQKIGLGFQASIPSYGISLKADLTETHTVQVIYGALGVVTNFSGRYRYNFSENENSLNVTPFIYAQAGTWSYDFKALDISENIFGYGFGAGIEFNALSWLSDKFRTTVELGYSKVDLTYYDFKATTFGFGIHYNLFDN